MTKTAYAKRMPDDQVAELTRDMTPEDREEFRLNNATSPLFDMWLRFVDVFADRAIDRLDISDADAEAVARRMEGDGGMGDAFAYLLRSISDRRLLRELAHKANAVWAASNEREVMSIPEIYERYAKLPRGDV